ncbi:GIY-YIG nuclease family protein [Streptococcus infantis]|uniref:GIY-YIG nuclease family protein n=1 Tax=Streptococcus infantis TaxID=68892 RepID=UPI0039C4CFFE
MDHKAYMYVVECCDGTYYTGYTTDVKKRIAVHNSGKGAKYTRARLPVKLIYVEGFDSKEEAMSAEALLKRKKRPQKERFLFENQDRNLLILNENQRAN